MKSVMIARFGDARCLQEYDLPVPAVVGIDDVLVKVVSAGINPLDLRKRKGELKAFYGKRMPMEIGNDIYGEIVTIKNKESKFKKGDKVFCMVDSGKNPGITGFVSGSGYSEYCITKEYTLAKAPGIDRPERLAAVPLACLTALQGLEKCDYGNKRSILIIGASGGVGLFVVQLAREKGLKVSTVSNSRAIYLMKELGADETYDYRDEARPYMNKKYDIVFDVACTMKLREAKRLLERGGFYLSNTASPLLMVLSVGNLLKRIYGDMKVMTYNWVKPNGRMLEAIAVGIENNTIRIEINKTFLLRDAADAHEYIENTSIIGKVILTIPED